MDKSSWWSIQGENIEFVWQQFSTAERYDWLLKSITIDDTRKFNDTRVSHLVQTSIYRSRVHTNTHLPFPREHSPSQTASRISMCYLWLASFHPRLQIELSPHLNTRKAQLNNMLADEDNHLACDDFSSGRTCHVSNIAPHLEDSPFLALDVTLYGTESRGFFAWTCDGRWVIDVGRNWLTLSLLLLIWLMCSLELGFDCKSVATDSSIWSY